MGRRNRNAKPQPEQHPNPAHDLLARVNDLLRQRQSGGETTQYLPRSHRTFATKGDTAHAMQRRGSAEDEDVFAVAYGKYGLLEPYYHFDLLWEAYEESDALSSNIQALCLNCERPHELEFVGNDTEEKGTPEAKREATSLRDFFSRVNEKYSLLRLRRKTRLDREVTGNAFWEILRNTSGQVERIYHVPATKVRASKIQPEYIEVTERLPRNGKMIEVPGERQFRKFARILDDGRITWFREFGDPRRMDANTGEYTDKPELEATELWWFRDPLSGETYGTPRWISALLEVRGRRLASWVNYDLLDNGAVPPFLITVQGGKLAPGTIDYLGKMLADWHNPGTYNQPIVLEVQPDLLGVDLNTGSTKTGGKLDIVRLRDDRSEDYLFTKYLAHTDEAIGAVFRIPGVIRGAAGSYNYASAYAALEFAEQQVFQPIREEFDEEFNVKLMQNEFKVKYWRLKTKAATIGNKEEFYRAAGMWGRTGGPSLNQMLQLANEAFGTDWSLYDGPFYNKIPLALLNSFVSSGKITVTEDGELELAEDAAANPFAGMGMVDLGGDEEPPAEPGSEGEGEGEGDTDAATEETEGGAAPALDDLFAEKQDRKRRLAAKAQGDATLLFQVLASIEKNSRLSPDKPIDEQDYVL